MGAMTNAKGEMSNEGLFSIYMSKTMVACQPAST